MKDTEKIIEQAISDVDSLPMQKQKNVLGNKQKYIKAISQAIGKEYISKVNIIELIMDDNAITYQSLGQYRSALIKAVNES